MKKRELGFRKGFQVVKKSLALSLSLFFCCLLGMGFYLLRDLQAHKTAYEQIIRLAEESDARIFSKPSLGSVPYWEKIYALREKIQERLEESKNMPPAAADAMDRCMGLFQAILPGRRYYYFTVEYVKIEPKEIWIEGRTESDLCFDLWRKSLRSLPWVGPEDDGIRLIASQPVPRVTHPKLLRQFKIWVKLATD